MAKSLQFFYKREKAQLSKPLDEVLKMANEIDVTVKLTPYIEKLNKSGAHILVTIEDDGKTFHNEIKGSSNNLQDISVLLKD